MNQSEHFYNQFHKSARPQAKTISKSNFTYAIILNILKETVKNTNSLNILDFGCGVGTLDIYLSNMGNNVTGLDISKTAVDLANENARLNSLSSRAKFYTNDYLQKYNNFKKFDLIICTEVLEHIKDDLDTLRLLLKFLKKNGKVLISVPSLNAPLYRLGQLSDFDKRVGHLRRYNENSARKLAENAGLQVLKVKKTEGILRNLLYTKKSLGILIKFIKGPLTIIFLAVDNLTVRLFGESDIFVLAQKP